jgi:CheY-like chemotaxis protein
MSRTILVVEDEPACLRLLSYFLKEGGYYVLQAQDGLEAVELLGELRVDLVVSDLKMPTMDGVALAQQIRSRVPDTPMLVVTAYAADDIKALSELRVPVMRKPFMPDQLNSQIQTMITVRRSLDDEL